MFVSIVVQMLPAFVFVAVAAVDVAADNADLRPLRRRHQPLRASHASQELRFPRGLLQMLHVRLRLEQGRTFRHVGRRTFLPGALR